MKKLISGFVLCFVFYPGFFLQFTGSTAVAQIKSSYKFEQANYILARHVFGSGGIIGASSANQRHHATAGQTIVGGMQGTSNLLLSGFWFAGSVPVGVRADEPITIPTDFKLHQNYPNPFNPETTIEYDLPNVCMVTVEIFNTVGQRIRLVSSQVQEPGHVTSVWDGRNDQEEVMGSGVYFYRVTAFAVNDTHQYHQIKFQQTKKMLLVK
jgi:hypothetical protein